MCCFVNDILGPGVTDNFSDSTTEDNNGTENQPQLPPMETNPGERKSIIPRSSVLSRKFWPVST